MRSTTRMVFFALVAAAGAILANGDAAIAQPLVTGDLTLYYDFDEIFSNEFLDESGNNFHGTIHEGDPFTETNPGTLTIEATNMVRGAGAARFTQSLYSIESPVYVDVHGADITANHPDQLPRAAISIAAWVNVTVNSGNDQSIFQARASGESGHGCPHFQLQGDGKLRLTLRNGLTDSVVDSKVYIDGTGTSGARYPANEWFHYAATYDSTTNAWSQYYNGIPIASGSGTGQMVGDWGGHESAGDYFAAGFGAVYDSGARRLDGWMDELYVFHRAITADEVAVLYNLQQSCAGTADFNCDGAVDNADLLTWKSHFGVDDGGDTDSDGDTDGNDFLNWQIQFGTGMGVAGTPIPEPSAFGLMAIAGWILAIIQKRREG